MRYKVIFSSFLSFAAKLLWRQSNPLAVHSSGANQTTPPTQLPVVSVKGHGQWPSAIAQKSNFRKKGTSTGWLSLFT